MKSDSEGRFEVRTILPAAIRLCKFQHMFTFIFGERISLQWVDDLRFEGDSYLTPT